MIVFRCEFYFITVTEWTSSASISLQQRRMCHWLTHSFAKCCIENKAIWDPANLSLQSFRLFLNCSSCSALHYKMGLLRNRKQAGLSSVSEPRFKGAKAGQGCQQPCKAQWTNLGQTSVWTLSLGSLHPAWGKLQHRAWVKHPNLHTTSELQKLEVSDIWSGIKHRGVCARACVC